MLTVLNHPEGDRVSVYDLGPNTSWVTYEPRFGQLDPKSELDMNIFVRSTGLENGDYDLVLKYIHNANGLLSEIPIHLNVDPSNGIEYEAGIPLDFGLRQNYPNPFNSRTIVPFSLSEASHTVVALYDITGRKVAVLMEARLQAGTHYVELDAAELVSGVYLIKLESGEKTAYMKMALIR